MEHLRSQDTRVLLTCLHELMTLDDIDTFPTQVMGMLRTVVPAQHCAYNEVNLQKQQMPYLLDPHPDNFPSLIPSFLSRMHEHPLIMHYQQRHDGQALKISDFLSQRQFTNLGLYTEFYRYVDTRYQISITLPSPPSLTVAFVLSRDQHDFSERERLRLNLLRPHLIQAYRNAETWSELRQEKVLFQQVLETHRLGVITVRSNGRILAMPERVRRWLETYCGQLSHAGEWLPLAVRQWFLQQRRRMYHTETLPLPQTPLVLEQEGRQLCLRLLTSTDEKLYVLLLEEKITQLVPSMLEALGLSRREAEVLYWVMQGKTNLEISTILSISARTVQTHLERIYPKLGVESRNAATVYAFERLGLVNR